MNESPQDFEFKMSFGLLSPHETHITHVYMEAIAITRHSDVAAKDVSQRHHDMEMLVALLTVYGGGGGGGSIDLWDNDILFKENQRDRYTRVGRHLGCTDWWKTWHLPSRSHSDI